MRSDFPLNSGTIRLLQNGEVARTAVVTGTVIHLEATPCGLARLSRKASCPAIGIAIVISHKKKNYSLRRTAFYSVNIGSSRLVLYIVSGLTGSSSASCHGWNIYVSIVFMFFNSHPTAHGLS